MRDKKLEFEVHEFACKCQYPDCQKKEQFLRIVSPLKEMVRYAMEKLDTFKDYIRIAYKTENCVIVVSSGVRCKKHNEDKDVRGEKNSKHLYNDPTQVAFDIQIKVNGKQLPDDEAMHHLHIFFGDKITYVAPTTKRGAIHVTLKVVR